MTDSYSERPLSPVRKMIAARTVETVQTIPHFRLHADIEIDALRALRAHRQRARQEGITVNDLIVKACAAALVDSPALNIQCVDGQIRDMHTVDIAVVVALEDGLSTPIIRECERKSVWEISDECRQLRERARRNALRTNEIFGGSFSISNLGMFAIPEFDALINPPQCAILAVGAARPVVLPAEAAQTRVATVMRVTLSCDHRAVDGATGAKFLGALKQYLEHPAQLF